ncbi:hypothetical protein BC830DRAFT_398208 [Chytriomyces sp. MP71]|nr:hypothetical protein BC830DRAFT_398208 [Chytriomyces sp. MP71]
MVSPMTSLSVSTGNAALPATAVIATTSSTFGTIQSDGSINIATLPTAEGTAANQETASSTSPTSRNLYVGIITGVAAFVLTVLAVAVVFYLRRTRTRRDSVLPSDSFKISKIMVNGTMMRLNIGAAAAEEKGQGEILTALSDFDPQSPDEIQVTRRDKITVDHVFDDLWATGFNHRTIENGVFPLAVFSPPAYERLFAKRVSSIDRSRKSVPPPVPPKDVIEPTVPKQQQQEQQEQHEQQQMKRNQQVYTAIYNFIAELPDEIPVTAGDKINVMQNFDDGWTMGYSFRLNKVGILPQGCLVGDLLEQGLSNDEYQAQNRVSSLHYSSSNTTVLDLESTESHD